MSHWILTRFWAKWHLPTKETDGKAWPEQGWGWSTEASCVKNCSTQLQLQSDTVGDVSTPIVISAPPLRNSSHCMRIKNVRDTAKKRHRYDECNHWTRERSRAPDGSLTPVIMGTGALCTAATLGQRGKFLVIAPRRAADLLPPVAFFVKTGFLRSAD